MPDLTTEEQDILTSVNCGEWRSVSDLKQTIKRYQQCAQQQINASEAISIDLPAADMQALRNIAKRSDTSVSLLMASVLHQYVASQSKST